MSKAVRLIDDEDIELTEVDLMHLLIVEDPAGVATKMSHPCSINSSCLP